MRIVFIGCVEVTFTTLNYLSDLEEAEIVGIVTRKESSFNADFRSLEPLAVKAGAPCFFAEGNPLYVFLNVTGISSVFIFICELTGAIDFGLVV